MRCPQRPQRLSLRGGGCRLQWRATAAWLSREFGQQSSCDGLWCRLLALSGLYLVVLRENPEQLLSVGESWQAEPAHEGSLFDTLQKLSDHGERPALGTGSF